jgi:16S rRNA (guanine966-N2)-methyltransferase
MLRIVAGDWGGQRIQAPRGRGTRPTSEKVRAAVFNVLAHHMPLEGIEVWDLFAGSGAMGIEALSRGARHASFVESDARAAAAITANLLRLKAAAGRYTVVPAKVERWLGHPRAGASPSLILIDAPYRTPEGGQTLERLAALPEVPAGAVVVLERAREADSRAFPALELWQSKRYGDTEVEFFVKGAVETDGAHRT